MIKLLNFLRRLLALRRVNLNSKDSNIVFSRKTKLCLKKHSRIQINNGTLRIGYPSYGSQSKPSYEQTILNLEEGSTIIINGMVTIGKGSYICLRKGSTLLLNGGNYIGNNAIVIVDKHMSIGENTSTSWNVTLIDDDGHRFFTRGNKPIKKLYNPLIIEKNVGIQMNVVIPRGVTIGENSIISANTTIRKNIPKDTLVYFNNELKEKYGFTTGFKLKR